jgi:transcriptional regulator with XRE-family HTH domain
MTNNKISSSRTGIPNPVDIEVGKRLKERRIFLGLSQTELANMLDISFQQVQKYEKGTNRISASRLVDLSNVLEVNITYFFNEKGKNESKDDLMAQRETLTLVRNYYKITDKKKRDSVITLCKALAENN